MRKRKVKRWCCGLRLCLWARLNKKRHTHTHTCTHDIMHARRKKGRKFHLTFPSVSHQSRADSADSLPAAEELFVWIRWATDGRVGESGRTRQTGCSYHSQGVKKYFCLRGLVWFYRPRPTQAKLLSFDLQMLAIVVDLFLLNAILKPHSQGLTRYVTFFEERKPDVNINERHVATFG